MSSLGLFKRGPGPLVSFLLPTRGRPEQLKRAVASLYDNALSRDSLEVLIKLDDDDPESLEAARCLVSTYPNINVGSGPRGNGYHDLHHWFNDMAYGAHGDWLFIFTDDAVMKTEHWDQVLQSVGTKAPWPAMDDVCLLAPHVPSNPKGCDFPVLRRNTHRILGTFGPTPFVDAWLRTLMTFTGAMLQPPIDIVHEKPDHTPLHGDDNRPSQVYFCRPDTKAAWETVQAASKLLARIDLGYAAERWDSRPPTAPGWYWWRKDSNSSKQFVAVMPGGAVSNPGGGGVEGLENIFVAGGEWCPQL